MLSHQEEEADHDDRVFYSLLERAGTMGNYQIFAVIMMCLIGYITGGVMLITPYIFYQDPYHCPNPIPGMTCFDYVCSFPLE